MSPERSRAAGAILLAALSFACSAETRGRILPIFFDGVPPPRSAGGAPAPGSAPAASAGGQPGYREHGPYAARLCGACHQSTSANALVAPADQLCFQCHALRLDRKYIHGPIASGGCLVCHDPHRSPNAALLVSSSDSFCFYCHAPRSVQAIEGHAGVEGGCTECHDAHASNEPHLLR